MNNDIRDYIKSGLRSIAICLVIWAAFTCLLCGLSNPRMTNTEILLHAPQSFILDFSYE